MSSEHCSWLPFQPSTLLVENVKIYSPFLLMGFNCLKVIELLRGNSFLFTARSLGVSGTHSVDHGRMKYKVGLGATECFGNSNPWIDNLAP